MAKFLANENVPGAVVDAARRAGHDLAWVTEFAAGADDDTVLAASLAESRVLVTFDKDFGEMAFQQGQSASCGVILLRPRLRTPEISLCSSRLLSWRSRSIGNATSAWPRKENCVSCRCPEQHVRSAFPTLLAGRDREGETERGG